MKVLTNAAVSKLNRGMVHLRGLDLLIGCDEFTHVLLVASASKFIKLIPLSTDSVTLIRVSFTLAEFANSAREVLLTLKRIGLKMLHSTGFCPMDDICMWEGYFEGPESGEIKDFITWLKKQNVVLEIEVEHLTFTD